MFPARLYCADVTCLRDPAVFERALGAVSPERRAKTEHFKRQEDQCRSLGAGLILFYALRDSGFTAEHPEILEGEYGKPYIPGSVLHFNLSHAGSLAVCAVATSPVGCDVERVGRDDHGIPAHYFSGTEQAWIGSGQTEEERNRRFCTLWTMRESVVKATGQGLSIDLRRFEIIPDGDGFRLGRHDFPGEYFLRNMSFREDYCCAVCSAEDLFESRVRKVRLPEML